MSSDEKRGGLTGDNDINAGDGNERPIHVDLIARRCWNKSVPLTFRPTDPSFNRANALYLAHAADVAYCRAPAEQAWERLGLRTVAFRNKVTRTRGFVGVCDDYAVLAFRGTDPVTLPNWLTDVVVRLVEREEYDGRVHHGFSSVLRRTWDKVEDVLEKAGDKPLFLTGHSMGGALAVLTACRLAKIGRPPVATYTFGSPRIGDHAFCAGYELPTYRIVNRLDLVPEMPLSSQRKLLHRTHASDENLLTHQAIRPASRADTLKTLVYIDRDGQIVPDADVEPWRVQSRAIATRGRVSWKDHRSPDHQLHSQP